MADDTYKPGTPVWVDLSTSDLDAARRFYEQLFGWTTDEPAGPEFGGYALFRSNGRQVAGSGPLQGGGQPYWMTFLRTADAAETTQKVRAAGGEVIVEPMQVMDAGTMAIYRDPTGAHVAVWQDGTNKGAELFNEPVSLTWNELYTRDVEAAKTFYQAAFGLTATGDQYIELQVDGKTVGGLMDLNSLPLPPEVPPHWLAYFAVANVEETAGRVEQLGGTVSTPPTEIPNMGRFAVIADPQGAVFAIFSQ